MSIYSGHNELGAEDEMHNNNSNRRVINSPFSTNMGCSVHSSSSCWHHLPLPINGQAELHNYLNESLEDIILYPQTTTCGSNLITSLDPHLNNEGGKMDVEYMHSYWGEQEKEEKQQQQQEQEQEKQRQRLLNLRFQGNAHQSSLNTIEQSYLNPPPSFITKVEMDSWPTSTSNSGLITNSHALVKQEHACTTLETTNWLHKSTSTSCSNPNLIHINNTQLSSSSVNHPPSPMLKSPNFSFTTRWPIPSLGVYPNPTPDNGILSSINPQQEPPYYPPPQSLQWNHHQNMASHSGKGTLDLPQESPSFKSPRLEVSVTSPHKSTQLVRKVKLGDRIAALQQLVSPFGKTDTASVLMETIGYIQFLHSQVEVLSTPYFKSSTTTTSQKDSSMKIATSSSSSEKGNQDSNGDEDPKQDLQSRGLCLVPTSSTMNLTNEVGSSYWPPSSFR